MTKLTEEYEKAKNEDSQKAYIDAYKRQNGKTIDNMTKNAWKKHEKTLVNDWQMINSAKNQSFSVDSAIMYMQNALSLIERQINSELRYTLHFKSLVSQQIT